MATGTNPAFRLLDDTDEPAGARVRRVGGLTFWAETLAFRTTAPREFIDVTDQVAGVLRRSQVTQGWVSVFSKHTTAAVVLNENEPLLLADFAALIEDVAPREAVYRHDDVTARTVNVTPDERVNGHAHCRALLLGPAACLNVVDGKLQLGRWQRVFLAELDGPREREISVLALGESTR